MSALVGSNCHIQLLGRSWGDVSEEFEVCSICLWVQTGHCRALNSKAQLEIRREDVFAWSDGFCLHENLFFFNLLLAIEKGKKELKCLKAERIFIWGAGEEGKSIWQLFKALVLEMVMSNLCLQRHREENELKYLLLKSHLALLRPKQAKLAKRWEWKDKPKAERGASVWGTGFLPPPACWRLAGAARALASIPRAWWEPFWSARGASPGGPGQFRLSQPGREGQTWSAELL